MNQALYGRPPQEPPPGVFGCAAVLTVLPWNAGDRARSVEESRPGVVGRLVDDGGHRPRGGGGSVARPEAWRVAGLPRRAVVRGPHRRIGADRTRSEAVR